MNFINNIKHIKRPLKLYSNNKEIMENTIKLIKRTQFKLFGNLKVNFIMIMS